LRSGAAAVPRSHRSREIHSYPERAACLKLPDQAQGGGGTDARSPEALNDEGIQASGDAAGARAVASPARSRPRRSFGTLSGFQQQPIRPQPIWRRGGRFKPVFGRAAWRLALGRAAYCIFMYSLQSGMGSRPLVHLLSRSSSGYDSRPLPSCMLRNVSSAENVALKFSPEG
jgi:hypothetical protein